MLSRYITSFNSFDGRHAIFLLGLIWMASPVAGSRPIRAARFYSVRMPRLVGRILSPASRSRVAARPTLRNHFDRAVHPKETMKKMGAFEVVNPWRTRHDRDLDRLV
jgi:hypothetical protein